MGHRHSPRRSRARRPTPRHGAHRRSARARPRDDQFDLCGGRRAVAQSRAVCAAGSTRAGVEHDEWQQHHAAAARPCGAVDAAHRPLCLERRVQSDVRAGHERWRSGSDRRGGDLAGLDRDARRPPRARPHVCRRRGPPRQRPRRHYQRRCVGVAIRQGARCARSNDPHQRARLSRDRRDVVDVPVSVFATAAVAADRPGESATRQRTDLCHARGSHEARDDARDAVGAGSGRRSRHGAIRRAALEDGRQHSLHGPGDDGHRDAAIDLAALWRHGAADAHGVRERGEPRIVAGVQSRARCRDPFGARRIAVAHDSSSAGRAVGGGRACPRHRVAADLGCHQSCGWIAARELHRG